MPNRALDVFHRLASDVVEDDHSTYVIVIGGVGWNRTARRFQEAIAQAPITQNDDAWRDIFAVEESERFYSTGKERGADSLSEFQPLQSQPHAHYLQWNSRPGRAEHCPLPDRCAGRDANEERSANRLPDGRFALLLRVPVVSNEALSPCFRTGSLRLYE